MVVENIEIKYRKIIRVSILQCEKADSLADQLEVLGIGLQGVDSGADVPRGGLALEDELHISVNDRFDCPQFMFTI